MADDPPKVFIGSSSEGQEYADALQALLEKRRSNVEWVMWSGDAFSLGRTNIENLVENADKCDYAILVVTPDDVTVSRGTERPSPRDNIVFEIGLFIGRLGRGRTAIVAEERALEALPTDLLGVMAADFRTHLAGKPRTSMEAIGPTISRISGLLAKASRKSHDGASWSPSPWTSVGVAHRHLEIFRCTRDGLEHRWFDEQEGHNEPCWSHWRKFWPPPPEPPIDVAACARPDGSRLDLFVLGQSARVAHLVWTASDRWSRDWTTFDGEVSAPLTAASLRPDHAEVYARGRGGRTICRWLRRHEDGTYRWEPWAPLWTDD